MKYTLLLLAFVVSTLSAQTTSNSILEENLYFDYQKSILSKNTKSQKAMAGFSRFEQSLYVDALWDLVEEGSPEAAKVLEIQPPVHYDLLEKLRLGILRLKYSRAASLPETLVEELLNTLKGPEVEIKLVYIIAAYEAELLKAGHQELVTQAQLDSRYGDVANDSERRKTLTDDVVTDVFYRTPDLTTYMNGEYIKSVKIYMFCRENRLYPCIMTMRNVHGDIVRNEDGSMWTNMALASSKQGLPSYSRNGNTPAGIHLIDSVMPTADQQISYGKYRRMMLNFAPKAKFEALHTALLPESSHKSDWWKPAVVARDIGRNLLRIHGTGKMNSETDTPYYPFMRTSGCIAQRENTYGDVTYQDQRNLLDQIMKAMDLEPTFENELKIKGILYLIEVDESNAPMTLKVLNEKGIE